MFYQKKKKKKLFTPLAILCGLGAENKLLQACLTSQDRSKTLKLIADKESEKVKGVWNKAKKKMIYPINCEISKQPIYPSFQGPVSKSKLSNKGE